MELAQHRRLSGLNDCSRARTKVEKPFCRRRERSEAEWICQRVEPSRSNAMFSAFLALLALCVPVLIVKL